MKTIHWLGAGLSSLPGIKKLACSENMLVLWNRTLAKAQHAVEKLGIDIPVKALDWHVFEEQLSEGDIVVSMLPASMHVQVAEICLGHKAHFVSSSYVSEEMAALDDVAKKAGLCFVNEVGLDPGIDHLFAHALMDKYTRSAVFNKDNQHFFRSYCGGFPKVANDFKYQFSWSPLGVLKALKSPAKWVNGAKEQTTERPWHALSDYVVRLDNQTQETFQAYPNRDSTPFISQYGFGQDWNIQEFVRGTLRLDGWAQAWQTLFEKVDTLEGDAGMQELTQISEQLWQDYQYRDGELDRVVLSVELEVKDAAGEKVLFKEQIGLDQAGNEHGSAMARLVSLTVAIAVESLMQNQLEKGVSAAPHEMVVVNDWLNQLSELGESFSRH